MKLVTQLECGNCGAPGHGWVPVTVMRQDQFLVTGTERLPNGWLQDTDPAKTLWCVRCVELAQHWDSQLRDDEIPEKTVSVLNRYGYLYGRMMSVTEARSLAAKDGMSLIQTGSTCCQIIKLPARPQCLPREKP